MEHNPRVIELAHLARALRAMDDFDVARAVEAERFVARARRALRVGLVDAEAAQRLRQEAEALGAVVLDGIPDQNGAAPRVIVADDETMRRLGSALDSVGERSLGVAIRSALSGYQRSEFSLSFADGGRMELGGETRVMGILNVTPDSFSDGGRHLATDDAVRAAVRMAEEGADLIDIGGESTRPGAAPVSEDEEIRRVVPIVEVVRRETALRISIDTTKARVARAGVEAGADMVNDVSALSDPTMARLVRDLRVPVVLMHMRGTPRTMQQDTRYVDLLSSVVGFLRKAADRAAATGISDDKIVVDPGLGFGKSATGNLRILRDLPTLRSVGRPILVGASRKSFIGSALDLPVDERLEGSLAVASLAAWHGVHIVRAHDVAATKRAVGMIDAIRKA